MAEKVEAFLVAYSSQERANSAPEFRNCALGGLSEERFEFAENLLDRVEIRRIRWQIERGRTHSLDRVRHTGYLMSRKVVHDDDVTAVERWSQTLFDVCEEDRPVHRPIDHERCDHPVVAQSDNQGDGLPMAVGNGPDQSFAPRATAPKSHQAGAGGGLVDEHQSGGIKQTLLANPAPPCPRRPVLARSAAGFFLPETLFREKNPKTPLRLPGIRCLRTPTPTRPKRRPGCSSTTSTSHSRAPPTGGVLPPLSFALAFPVSYQ